MHGRVGGVDQPWGMCAKGLDSGSAPTKRQTEGNGRGRKGEKEKKGEKPPLSESVRSGRVAQSL